MPDTYVVSSEPLVGSITPSTYTRPLIVGPPGPCGCGCALTPETSYGFGVAELAELLGRPLDPWQRWAAIHIGELMRDGRPRFRKVLLMVARQNGKSELLKMIGLYFLLVAGVKQILSMSNKFEYARALWTDAYNLTRGCEDDEIKESIPVFRPGNNDPHMSTAGGESTWKICAANGDAGRSGSNDLILMDELRQQHTFDAWSASIHTLTARRRGQLIAATNEGTPASVVLDALRKEATDGKNRRTGIFAWQASESARPDDPAEIVKANPNVGHRIELEDLLDEGIAAGAEGGDRLTEFLTEAMCVRVPVYSPALDSARWIALGPTEERPALKLAEHRDRLATCLDVSRDGKHATLSGAAVVDGVVHVGIIAAWDTPAKMRAELPGVIAKVRPRSLAWFPNGPTAAFMVELAKPRRATAGQDRWPPRGVELVEIKSETPAVCMGFAEQVDSDSLRNDGHELAGTHVANAIRKARGDLWVFDRKGLGHIDAVYAMAGAVHSARALPPPRVPLRSVGGTAETVKSGKAK